MTNITTCCNQRLGTITFLSIFSTTLANTWKRTLTQERYSDTQDRRRRQGRLLEDTVVFQKSRGRGTPVLEFTKTGHSPSSLLTASYSCDTKYQQKTEPHDGNAWRYLTYLFMSLPCSPILSSLYKSLLHSTIRWSCVPDWRKNLVGPRHPCVVWIIGSSSWIRSCVPDQSLADQRKLTGCCSRKTLWLADVDGSHHQTLESLWYQNSCLLRVMVVKLLSALYARGHGIGGIVTAFFLRTWNNSNTPRSFMLSRPLRSRHTSQTVGSHVIKTPVWEGYNDMRTKVLIIESWSFQNKT